MDSSCFTEEKEIPVAICQKTNYNYLRIFPIIRSVQI